MRSHFVKIVQKFELKYVGDACKDHQLIPLQRTSRATWDSPVQVNNFWATKCSGRSQKVCIHAAAPLAVPPPPPWIRPEHGQRTVRRRRPADGGTEGGDAGKGAWPQGAGRRRTASRRAAEASGGLTEGRRGSVGPGVSFSDHWTKNNWAY